MYKNGNPTLVYGCILVLQIILLFVGDHIISQAAFLTDPEEGVYRHLLHPREGLVHKLEEFEDHRLEELPMSF